MTTAALTEQPTSTPVRGDALMLAVRLWFVAMVAGQWLFLYYIAVAYGPSSMSGDFAAWNRHNANVTGYVPGDTAGNLAFAGHVLLAAVVTFGGTVQLIPWLRAHAPAIHRFNGRLFLLAAFAASLAGLYMTYARGGQAGLASHALAFDGVLILVFGALAWRAARGRDFASHRRWALRTFMAANAVWFVRVGIVPLLLLSKVLGGPKPTLDGPVFVAWSFGAYLVPLAVLELYLRVADHAGPRGRRAMAGLLLTLTGLMSVGIVFAWLFIWSPVLAKL